MSVDSRIQEQWESLPDGCPMRDLDFEAFRELWGDPDPWALAMVDPYLRRPLSWLFAEVIIGTANDYQLGALKQHFEWLVKSGSAEDVGRFSKDLTKCKENAAQPDERLLGILSAKQHLESQRECEEDCGTAATQIELRRECHDRLPTLFPPPDDMDGWKSIMLRAKRHQPIARGKAGRPRVSKNRGQK